MSTLAIDSVPLLFIFFMDIDMELLHAQIGLEIDIIPYPLYISLVKDIYSC